MLNNEIKRSIEESVLCWLATVDAQGQPNVSPKEMFTYFGEKHLLIAQIASPKSLKNIKQNTLVCVSFLEIFKQKGYKIKGIARLISPNEPDFLIKKKTLTELYTDRFEIKSIFEIEISEIAQILAPSYVFYPDTSESLQIESAMKTYKVKAID